MIYSNTLKCIYHCELYFFLYPLRAQKYTNIFIPYVARKSMQQILNFCNSLEMFCRNFQSTRARNHKMNNCMFHYVRQMKFQDEINRIIYREKEKH